MVLAAILSARLSVADGSSLQATLAMRVVMILTSFAFLAPAKYAARAGRPFHVAMFATMAMTCAVYHLCDAEAPIQAMLLHGGHCPDPLTHILTLADHASAYFCILQMAFMLLGPEDHNLQWPHEETTPRKPWARVPTRGIVYNRALPLLAMLVFLALNLDFHMFHCQMLMICAVVLLHGAGQFWWSNREHAPQVLFHAVFWNRLISLGLLPISLCLPLLYIGHVYASGLAHAAWHVLIATMAMNIQRTLYHSLPDPLHTGISYLMGQDAPLADILSSPPKNPAVAHYLLSGVAVTTCLTLLADRVTRNNYDLPGLPVFGMDRLQWTGGNGDSIRHFANGGGFLVASNALFTLVAIAAAFFLISTVQINTEGKWEVVSRWRQLGCSLGYLSTFFGLLVVLASVDGTPPNLRTLALGATTCTAAAAVLLTTFEERWEPGASWMVASIPVFRRVVAACTGLAAAGFVASLFMSAWRGVTLTQHIFALLLAVWPLTYVGQVRERWAPQEALTTKLPK